MPFFVKTVLSQMHKLCKKSRSAKTAKRNFFSYKTKSCKKLRKTLQNQFVR